MKVESFMDADFIVKIGQYTTDTIIILEGHVKVYGHFRNQLFGILSNGSHFGLDLCKPSMNKEIQKIH